MFFSIVLALTLVALGLTPKTDASVFNAIVPGAGMTTGWFAKPGPTESIIFGLLVLKVMALRLAGVFPYNLNDLWKQNGILGDTLLKDFKRRIGRDLSNNFIHEIDAVERILLGLRRIDTHDCFIRHVCQIKQNQLKGQSSDYEDTVLKIFSMRRPAKAGKMSIWDIYQDALTPKVTDCERKYKLCPLTKQDLSAKSLLSGFF